MSLICSGYSTHHPSKDPSQEEAKEPSTIEEAKAKAKEEAPTGPGNKRRKTKRKSKAPAAFRDDEDDPLEDLEPPKKRRKDLFVQRAK